MIYSIIVNNHIHNNTIDQYLETKRIMIYCIMVTNKGLGFRV
jgi:hypothetical protein